jgi:hypothetical protein
MGYLNSMHMLTRSYEQTKFTSGVTSPAGSNQAKALTANRMHSSALTRNCERSRESD